MKKTRAEEFFEQITEQTADVVVENGVITDAVKSAADSDIVTDIVNGAGDVAEGVVGFFFKMFE